MLISFIRSGDSTEEVVSSKELWVTIFLLKKSLILIVSHFKVKFIWLGVPRADGIIIERESYTICVSFF
uniref:Uncharacterized protein n=1 Tax=uncultured marine virus TaxID=186617 RepID=A0A0F7LBE6_9VIRU|nr:hypothetical protein [uncultured marine virus]